MGIIDKIKLVFKLNSFINAEIKEAKMPTASGKPGWKTTEFWLSLGGQLATLFGAVKGFIPPQYAAIIIAVGTAVYTIAATVRKAVADVQAAKATQTTVTTTEPVTTVTTPA